MSRRFPSPGLLFPTGLAALPVALSLACSGAPAPAPLTSPVARAPAVSVAASAPPAVASVAPVAAPPPVKRLTLTPWKGPATGTTGCERLDALQARLDRRAPKVPPYTELPSLYPCQTAHGGAWRLLRRVDDYEVSSSDQMMHPDCQQDGSCMYVAHVTLTPAFAPTGKGAVEGPAQSVEMFRGEGGGEHEVNLYDLDGDGTEEILILSGRTGRIFTFRDGKVTPYRPADDLAFTALVDVDSDGRPDLKLDNPYANPDSVFECGRRGGHPLLGLDVDLTFVAHGRPDGSFALDDEVARRAVLPDCPERPTVLARATSDGRYDIAKVWQNTVCARLWGWSAAETTAALDQQCTPVEDDCEALFEARDGGLTRGCAGRDKLATWIKVTPPLTLRR